MISFADILQCLIFLMFESKITAPVIVGVGYHITTDFS